ncbi:MAG: SusD/RagB family nutrient-binding outer membrane lipoprotein [Bacteroidetes bacterium]|nr:SusD/RagB family nutrient-binding outer membrane lipoprotein [Bacteroidota bacterium]
MKKIIRIFLLVIGLSIAVSCNDVLDINTNPNTSTTANVEQVLTSGQIYMSDFQRRIAGTNNTVWAQYWTWGPGVALGPVDKHEFAATSADGSWARAYSNCLKDLDFVIDSGEDLYGGIAQLLSVYIYGLLVDYFNDIPYSEALKGDLADGGITSPAYDDAATIYTDLIATIDEAIARLAAPTLGSLEPGVDDLFYEGDLVQWIRFGNSLKLKLLMRQSVNGGPADLATQVSDVITAGNLIESADDNLMLEWTGDGGSQNPWFAALNSGLGNFYVLSNTTLDFLNGVVPGGDPRLDVFYDLPAAASSHNGAGQGNIIDEGGQQADYSKASDNVWGVDVPTIMMTATEVLFYKAEAALRYGTDDPESAVAAAITSSFDYWGIGAEASDYIVDLNFGGASDQMQIIAEQMWVAFNATQSGEGWITTRKFDNATNNYFATNGILVSPADNSLGTDIFPSIWRYPQSEIDRNSSLTGSDQHDLVDFVFWDN